MKESELIKMQKEMAQMKQVLDYLLGESNNVKTLASGTFEIVKRMECYDKAITELSEQIKEQYVERKLD